MEKKTNLKNLFFSFLRIGAFTFGGGYAMIPLIQKETVDKYHWVDDDDILDILAIAESTPGVFAVNSATFIGYKVEGFLGSLVATVGVALPSFLIILILSAFYQAFRQNPWVEYAFLGIRAGVSVLLLNTVLRLGKKLKNSPFTIIVLVLSFSGVVFFSINAITVIVIAALAGIIYGICMRKKMKREGRQ